MMMNVAETKWFSRNGDADTMETFSDRTKSDRKKGSGSSNTGDVGER